MDDTLTTEMQQVLASYPIGDIISVGPAGGTAGKCWRVSAATGDYFLRLRGARTSSVRALEFDHGFRRHLLDRGVPTAAPIETSTGDTWVLVGERAYEMYRFVDGRPFAGGAAELSETARALAHFHLAAAEYPARGAHTAVPSQFAIAAPHAGGSERIDDPDIMLAAFQRFEPQDPALDYAIAQARLLTQAYGASVYEALPRWLIHGDFHPGNLLYSNQGEVVGIFDLDWACEHTRSRDLADAVYYFAGKRSEPFDGSSIVSMTDAAEPDIPAAALFLQAYRSHAPLEPHEVRAIPWALRARLLAERIEGSAKVPPEKRIWFVTRDLERPLQWLDAHADALLRSLGPE